MNYRPESTDEHLKVISGLGDNNPYNNKSISTLSLLISFTRYWSQERAIGVVLIIYAVLVAIQVLNIQEIHTIINGSVINPVILSHWYLVSGLVLLKKGNKANSLTFLLCVIPLFITAFTTFFINLNINAIKISDFLSTAFILQRLLTKTTTDIIEKIAE